jgi:hypothetical protein
MIEKKHNEIQKDICSAVMRANFRNHVSNFIRDLFGEYLDSYPEITVEEITSMMICEMVYEINTTARLYRNARE